MSNHTPGPWVMDETGGLLRVRGANGSIVYDFGFYPTTQELANARLITAAPELLETLEMILVQFGEYQDGDGAAKYHAINIAKEAIAKAKGE